MYRTSNAALEAMIATGDRILADLAKELLAARAVVEAVPSILQDYENGIECALDAHALVQEMDALLVAHEKAAG